MKYRALVADDEPMIRRGIISFLSEYDDFEVVAEAEDGEMALEKAKTTPIDVFFVDINMPFMNGLDFIRELKLLYPDVLVVIITGYDVFEYARKAVSLGVFDYLVKPLMEDAFEELIGRLRKELRGRTAEETEKRYLKWAKGKMAESRELMLSEFMKRFIDGRLSEDEIDEECAYLGLDIPDAYTLILVKIEARPSKELKNSWNDDLLYFVSENIALEMFAALSYEIKCRDESDDLVLIIPRTERNILEDKMTEYKKYVSDVIPVKVSTAHTSGEGLSTVAESYQKALTDISEDKGMSSVMEAVIELVQENYQREDFSLQEAADTIGLSVPYLSRIFRKEAGCTFVDYLTNLRMRKASILLQDDDYKIYEVAEMVGYSSQQYFSQVFKKKFGVNPIDYKQSLNVKKS